MNVTPGVTGRAIEAAVRFKLRAGTMPARVGVHRFVLWSVWRYRHLAVFVLVGFLSLVVEGALLLLAIPREWSFGSRCLLGFAAGMLFAAVANARFNFQVPGRQFLRTLGIFCLISLLSFALDTGITVAAHLTDYVEYSIARFVTAGCLFGIAYFLHSRFTFRRFCRRFGLAVYPTSASAVTASYRLLGDFVDHVHLDIVDSTFNPEAAPVDVPAMQLARQMWAWQPLCLHLMSARPLSWLKCCLRVADWVVIHLNIEDDPLEVIGFCRRHNRRVGVAWQHGMPLSQIMPYLPHVDFVLVLGVAVPGRCGQELLDEAIGAASSLVAMERRYGYKVIFDGGIKPENIEKIPARYLVAHSGVFNAERPLRAALTLMTGNRVS
jgi:ribulose-phosphate 3-epimerase